MRFILGPCVVESETHAVRMAALIKRIVFRRGADFIFKASFDKANRTSVDGFRGVGLAEGLRALRAVQDEVGCLITTDIHEPGQADRVADVVDVIQIPALLSRQTDLLVAAGRTGKIVNIKKGQFMAPLDMRYAIDKVISDGAAALVWVTERGTTFGYHNLVVDMRSIPLLKSLEVPVIFDASHSAQFPGGGIGYSNGQRAMIPVLARAAVAAGADGVFCEVHDNPDRALCDGQNSLHIDDLDAFVASMQVIASAVR